MSTNISELSGRKGLKENLFEQLGLLAQETGTPSTEQLEKLAADFLIGKANTYGSASFYDFTREENKGKKVYVCNGSACLCAGTQPSVHEKLKLHYQENEIGDMCCLGRCHENSAFHIDGINYSGSAIDHLSDLAKNKETDRIKPNDVYQVKHIGTKVLTTEAESISSYYELLKLSLQKSPESLLEEIKISGLRGRGGAGFPMSFKLEACKKEINITKFVVCNADEGDPGAYSDRYLLEQQPHKVLLGMMLAGYIIGAEWGVLYIRGEYPEAVNICEVEINKLRALNILGRNIFGTNFNFDFKIIKAQGAYICGEETALLSSIEGQRPEVRVRPPYPAQKGLFNKPTIVNNVETLACIPYILSQGGKQYASIGKGKSTGTKLVSLDGYFNSPGIYEVDMGTPLRAVIDDLGGGFESAIKAMHIGGPLGGLVPISKINELSIDFESFNQAGFLLGHASIVCIPESFPIIKYIEHLFQFTAHESCGKCFPCRIGSTRGYEMMNKAQTSDYKINRKLLDDLLETLEIGSLCALGGGLPLPIKNALTYFEIELSEWMVQ
ncbi:MAG TPA: NADH-ubiquinone oxidoreductase-F iron-sulfur binding region domain-containing protein [Chitinophagaceae bacterium]|nr:NADH-ubiquinone oxidoreductase-F iron-sulfur binding region domain-containing protein [Chitinophagaceae bacterium]